MPRFFPSGDILSSGVNGPVCLHRRAPGGLPGFQSRLQVGQGGFAGPVGQTPEAGLVFQDTSPEATGGEARVVVATVPVDGAPVLSPATLPPQPATNLVFGGNLWAGYMATRGGDYTVLHTGARLPGSRPWSLGVDRTLLVSQDDNRQLLLMVPESGTVRRLVWSGSSPILEAVHGDEGTVLWRTVDGRWWLNGLVLPLPLSVGTVQLCRAPATLAWWMVGQRQDGGVAAFPISQSNIGITVAVGESTFNPCGWWDADARLHLAWSRTAGEDPATIVEQVFSPGDVGPLSGPAPNPGPTPTPTPSPDPAASLLLRAFPMRCRVSAFFSYSERYGDTPDPIGHCETVVDDETDPVRPGTQAALQRTLGRLASLGRPLVIGDTPQGPLALSPALQDLTLGWWASGAALADLGASVARCQSRPGAKYTLAYLDRGDAADWGTTRPAWLTDDVIPELQAYPRTGEAPRDFSQRLFAMAERVQGWLGGRKLAFCFRFDRVPDRDTVIGAIPVYLALVYAYRPAFLHLFADRRGEGLAVDPGLRAWAHQIAALVPGPTGRYDYVVPRGLAPTDAVKAQLSQDVDLYALSQAARRGLLTLLSEARAAATTPEAARRLEDLFR